MAKKVKDIKTWLKSSKHQFAMVGYETAMRLKDGVTFNTSSNSCILYRGYDCNILDFMADYVHVHINVQQSTGWFDDEVSINDVLPDFSRGDSGSKIEGMKKRNSHIYQSKDAEAELTKMRDEKFAKMIDEKLRKAIKKAVEEENKNKPSETRI